MSVTGRTRRRDCLVPLRAVDSRLAFQRNADGAIGAPEHTALLDGFGESLGDVIRAAGQRGGGSNHF
jgi:hypothetical protein